MRSNSPHPQASDIPKQELTQSTTGLNDSNRPWLSKSAMSGIAGPPDMNDSEDSIEDDYDSYDELFTQHFTEEKLSQLDGLEIQSCFRGQAQSPAPHRRSESQRSLGGKAKRFLLQSQASSKPELSNNTQLEEIELPWAQKYAPRTLEELAVHKRKVQDVEHWLNDALAGKSQKSLLVLKGPAGSGKTATVSLLSDKLNFRIVEWKSPSASDYASRDYISLGAQFDGFLSRGQEFGSLDLDSHDGMQMFMGGQPYTSQRRVLLIEEFPATSGRGVSNLAAFRLSLLRYISRNASPSIAGSETQTNIPPMVIVVTETFSNLESSFDNVSAHRLLGYELYNHSSTSVIEFNTIAPTFMSKALNSVLKRCANQPFPTKSETQSMIAHLSRIGDIRNAIASLELICLGSGGPSKKHATNTRKAMAPFSNKIPHELTSRTATLGLFHAVGKIIYNKRNPQSDTIPPQSPLLLGQAGNPLVHVNDLPEETGTDIQSFISTLHENYIPSCDGFSFAESLDGCVGFLSDSDMLCVDRTGHPNRYQAGFGMGLVKCVAGVDVLRQEEISYQIAARGLLFALPYPVRRQLSGTGPTRRPNDLYKLSFPPGSRLSRQLEETQGLISLMRNTLLESVTLPIADRSTHQNQPTGKTVGEASLPFATLTSRSDLVLYQLPYMTMILGADAGSVNIKAITTLVDVNHDAQQDSDYPKSASARDQSASFIHEPRLEAIARRSDLQKPWGQQPSDEQLILSDDDIVDDLELIPT
ncbi:Rad17 cell cycle checkpoint protein-domain-containing protein [Aspergillus venezuelensis]